MPSISLNSKFSISQSFIPLDVLRNTFLFGVDIKDLEGNSLSEESYNNFIDFAISEIETFLEIKVKYQIISQTVDFISDDYIQNGFIKLAYPIVKPISIEGYIGTFKHVQYPKDWLSVSNTGTDINGKNMFILPNYSSMITYGYLSYPTNYTSFWHSNKMIPNYWKVKYITGFKTIPLDLLNFIYKLASINVLSLGGQLKVAGLNPGVNSQSISLDGLSQSTSGSGTGSGGPYSSLIKQYRSDLISSMPYLKGKYSSINFTVC